MRGVYEWCVRAECMSVCMIIITVTEALRLCACSDAYGVPAQRRERMRECMRGVHERSA
jgi:hypothetical protein